MSKANQSPDTGTNSETGYDVLKTAYETERSLRVELEGKKVALEDELAQLKAEKDDLEKTALVSAAEIKTLMDEAEALRAKGGKKIALVPLTNAANNVVMVYDETLDPKGKGNLYVEETSFELDHGWSADAIQARVLASAGRAVTLARLGGEDFANIPPFNPSRRIRVSVEVLE
jgi:hypothetical protein